jgi:CheY-like chemotaxis protein
MSAVQILVVDDSLPDRISLGMAFEACGYPVDIVFAEHGQSALDLLHGVSAHPPLRPKLMLVDMKMPGVTGLDVLSSVKKDPELRAIPVMILSGSDDPHDIRAAYHAYASGYVRKPREAEQLKRLARTIGALCAEALVYPVTLAG